jgi:ubiquinone/menaquinone biosynthesis C-methylase UbiE
MALAAVFRQTFRAAFHQVNRRMKNMSTAAAPEAHSARSQYVDFWNDILVPKFVRWRHILVGGLTLHSAKVFPSLAVEEGDLVVDAGCGFGDTAIQLARMVGPKGSVLALDCCDGFLEYGRQDAKAAGVTNIRFVEADVQNYPFEPVHDFCFSRFGTQFFENPVAGLRNMRKSLRPGGTMTMIVWRGIKDNPWLGSAKEVVLQFLPPPGDNAQTCGPGPFSMADPGVVTKQLEIAGYQGIEFEQIDAQVFVGKDLDDAVAFQLAIGPAGEVYREAGKLAEERHAEITQALKDRLRSYLGPDGVMMDSSSWKITARNPLS